MRQGQGPKVKRVASCAIVVLIALGLITLQQGHAHESPIACSLTTLNGLYVFDATIGLLIPGRRLGGCRSARSKIVDRGGRGKHGE